MKTKEFGPITPEQIQDYAELSGDHNPIHIDPEFARASGLPAPIAHGMLSLALACSALEEWGFPSDRIKTLESKFRSMLFVQDRLICELVSESLDEVQLVARNQKGDEILSLQAQIRS